MYVLHSTRGTPFQTMYMMGYNNKNKKNKINIIAYVKGDTYVVYCSTGGTHINTACTL